MSQIHERLVAIMRKVPPIAKDSQNKQQGFNYRGIDAVYNTLQPLFAEQGVVLITEVLESKVTERKTNSGGTLYNTALKMNVHFVAEDGSEVVATVYGEGSDSGDKGYNKAMSVGLKYAMFQTFLIPTASIDPDGESPETTTPPQQKRDRNADLAAIEKILSDAVLEGLISTDMRSLALGKAAECKTPAAMDKFREDMLVRIEELRAARAETDFEDDIPL